MSSASFASYTHVALLGRELGVRVRNPHTRDASYYKVPFQPRTYTTASLTHATDQWRTLDGRPLKERVHANIGAYDEYVRASEREGRALYGVISPVQQFMATHVPVNCGVSLDQLRTVYLDIEVGSAGGFAPPDDPFQPIVAITALVWGEYTVWGCGDYTPSRPNVRYIRCVNEEELLFSFLQWWTDDYPDIISGWNVQGYDIPYIVNRINRLVDERRLPKKYSGRMLSPWRKMSQRHATLMGRDMVLLELVGVSVLDYLELYRKFSLTQRESYRLDAIAEAELGKKKIAYDEYGSLQKLAEENYQKFIDYNIVDVELVQQLNDKLHHIDLAVQIAYGARVNFLDTFKQVRLWDAMMYYDLHARQIAVPQKTKSAKAVDFVGAYVKDPIVGKHEWVVSFDVNSLYPSIMRQWNISPDRHLTLDWLRERLEDIDTLKHAQAYAETPPPETLLTPRAWLQDVQPEDVGVVAWALRELIAYLEQTNSERMLDEIHAQATPWPWLRVLSVCITPNGQAFRVDESGFLPSILSRLYEERKKAKQRETECKKKAAKATTAEEKLAFERESIMWGLQQNTRKINLNSCYGALGSEHHRFFDARHAEAVTLTGQVLIRHVARQVNASLNAKFGTTTDYILASDTDSIYVKLAPVAKNVASSQIVDVVDAFCEQELQPVIDAAFNGIHTQFNTLDNVMGMKREAIAEHGVWTAKKRYLLWVHDNEGVRFNPPKLKMTGIEAVRSSTPKYAREIIKKSLEYFLQNDQDHFYTLLDEAEEGFLTRPFEDIASPRSVNGLDTYDPGEGEFLPATPIHVKGAITFNRELERTKLTHKYPKIRNSEKIRFCYLKPQNPLRCNVIAAPNTLPAEWNLERYLDRSLQFEKSVLSPLENIIQVAGWAIRPLATLF